LFGQDDFASQDYSGGRTGLTRLENIPKNRQLATIVIIADALVNADLSGDQAWF
jgi:hypothetical protein